MEITNEIYHHTRTSLMTIVSANVADNTLESVMLESGLTEETVNADHMMQLIRGPIYREFQTIVPKEGLKRQLTKLLTELQKAELQKAELQKNKQNKSAPQKTHAGNVADTGQMAQAFTSSQADNSSKTGSTKKAKAAATRARIPGLTKIKQNAIGVPRAYFRDLRDDAFNIQMPLFGTDPHVVLDNGTRAVLRYWVSEVSFLDPEELKKAGFRRFSFMVEEESHPNPTIVKLLAMLREEEEAEQESLMLERLAQEAKEAAERDIAEKAVADANKPKAVIQITQKDIEQLVDDYAELEDVSYLAMLRLDGEVLKTKGRGLQINDIKTTLLESINRLRVEQFQATNPDKLEQFSKCKSILLHHDSGVLFVLNFGEILVMLYGTQDFNIGLMYSYAAMVGLQEEDVDSALPSDEDFKEMI